MNRYFIRFCFNGSGFHGWQIQHNAITVQSEINRGLSLLLGADVNVTGAGRTDTGVHARDFYAHFDIRDGFDCDQAKELVFKLNRFFDYRIAVKEIRRVKPDAHARFSALSRTYEYLIAREKQPFLHDQSYYIYGSLNVQLMQKAALILMEYDDFTSFSKLHTEATNNLCRITEAVWTEEEGLLRFRITANRFLRNMVRAIVGTLLDVGREAITPEGFRQVILLKDRGEAGFSVPPEGLYLIRITYPEDLFIDH